MKDLTREEVIKLDMNNWLRGQIEELTENFGVMRTSLCAALLVGSPSNLTNDPDHVVDVVCKLEQLSGAWDAIYALEQKVRR